MRHGQEGLFRYDGGILEGNWRNNRVEGLGRLVYPNGDVYHGQWKNYEANGFGAYKRSDGSVYEGD